MCELAFLLLENERGLVRKGRTLQILAGTPPSRDSTLLSKTGMAKMEKILEESFPMAQDDALTKIVRSGQQIVLSMDDVNRTDSNFFHHFVKGVREGGFFLVFFFVTSSFP